jgi:hypothetical protein
MGPLGCQNPAKAVSPVALIDLLDLWNLFGPAAGVSLLGSCLVSRASGQRGRRANLHVAGL